ncbi:hypothetical protein [Salegentibacter sp.]|uniref:hypothetical protein n=1 Tax=Salegentibacter sp. TaxID=1903072 RepID=UPI00356B5D5B
MKKTLLVILLATLGFNANAQEKKNDNLDNFGKIELGFHGLSFGYDLPISNKFVWENAIGAGMGMSAENNSASYTLDITRPVPFFKSKLKFVYNINKRIEKEKITLNNSGNFVALQTKYSFGRGGSNTFNPAMLTEVHWGIQRSLGGNFIFNTHIGLGFVRDFDTNSTAFSPTFGLAFGYRIF